MYEQIDGLHRWSKYWSLVLSEAAYLIMTKGQYLDHLCRPSIKCNGPSYSVERNIHKPKKV